MDDTGTLILAKIEGTGIGLTITKKMVEQMQGKIDVRTEVGVGTTFWVEFPIDGNSN